MSKIIFVGDCHLKGSTPISRKDNYPETILNKLLFIKEYAQSIACKHIFFLGDIFDNVSTTFPYFSHCLSLFKSFKDDGIDLYTIAGNHDLKYDALETITITPLGVLIKSGVFTLLGNTEIEGVKITGFSYTETPTPNVNAEGYSIALLHRFYESGFGEEPITEEQVVSLGYNTYIFGHDHRPYQTKVISDTIKVIRPGSLARNSSDQYNRIRKPRILVFDTDTLSFYYEEVRSEAGQEVFFENVEEERPISMSDLVTYLQSAYHSSGMSIREYLDSITIPEASKSLIIGYLDILGA